MFQNLITFLSEVSQNLRLADIVDIIFVSAFLYTIINILRNSVSRKLLITIAVFIGIYILSRILGMYLTEMFIKILIIFISISAIIVFQPDIRRMVDQVSRWVLSRRPKHAKSEMQFIDILTESVSKMAEMKTGALIAVKGIDDWDGCVNGGINLGGAVSKPLLLSIFNTKAPGHDGAVLIENGNVIKFGAHLTLSTNMEVLQGKGTRHAAGLGLSECCDALIIIVSEERGTITIANNGVLQTLSSSSELKNLIEKFWIKNFSEQTETKKFFSKSFHFKTAVTSFLLAATGWFMFAYQSGTVFKSFDVPIEFRNLRSDLELKYPIPADAKITLSGSEQAFRLLDEVDLSISVDLYRLKTGSNEIMIAQDNLKLPSGIKLYNIEPHVIRINAERLKSIEVPIHVQTSGRLPRYLRLLSINSNPEKITLKVPEEAHNLPRNILTEPVNLSNLTESSVIKTRLIPMNNAKLLPDQKPEILIELKVAKK